VVTEIHPVYCPMCETTPIARIPFRVLTQANVCAKTVICEGKKLLNCHLLVWINR